MAIPSNNRASPKRNVSSVVLSSLHHGTNQRFSLVDLGNGYFKIVSKLDPKMVLNAQGGGSPANGTPIILHQDNGGDNQQWRLESL